MTRERPVGAEQPRRESPSGTHRAPCEKPSIKAAAPHGPDTKLRLDPGSQSNRDAYEEFEKRLDRSKDLEPIWGEADPPEVDCARSLSLLGALCDHEFSEEELIEIGSAKGLQTGFLDD